MSTKAEQAEAIFHEGFNCSQAVFGTFSEDMGISREQALKIACGFGSGLSQTGDLCGAVTGAVMVIGLKYGKSEAEDYASTAKTYKLTGQFIEEFRKINGSVNCTELVGYNLSNEKELQQARDSGVFRSICPKMVKNAVEVLEMLLS